MLMNVEEKVKYIVLKIKIKQKEIANFLLKAFLYFHKFEF